MNKREVACMNQQLINTFFVVLDNKNSLVYNLYFKNALYSLECKKHTMEKPNERNYYYLENFTEDEGEAEYFFHRITEGRVYPIHVQDIALDMF